MRRRNFNELREGLLERPGGQALERARQELREELSLAELRKARSFTQTQLAQALDTTQPGVSRIEHQTDLYLSTLRGFVEALGGELEVCAHFPDARISIRRLSRSAT